MNNPVHFSLISFTLGRKLEFPKASIITCYDYRFLGLAGLELNPNCLLGESPPRCKRADCLLALRSTLSFGLPDDKNDGALAWAERSNFGERSGFFVGEGASSFLALADLA